MRQDPDVIMVGEIRDSETANIAVQAALTGHRVLSTLHTNTAIGAIARLEDMGIDAAVAAEIGAPELVEYAARLAPLTRRRGNAAD